MLREPWTLSDPEWEALGHLLGRPAPKDERRGRPRCDDRPLAQACLFHLYRSNSPVYNSFGWQSLRKALGVSPATANRRYREWTADGSWEAFWAALQAQRQRGRRRGAPPKPPPARSPGFGFPVSNTVSELERAYTFFNACLFESRLPRHIAISLERSMRRRRRGEYCGNSWRQKGKQFDHIRIRSSMVHTGVAAVLETLIHEMVHLCNATLGIKDCTAGGVYHNHHFRDRARMAGLIVENVDAHHGCALTTLGPRAKAAIRRLRPTRRLFVE